MPGIPHIVIIGGGFGGLTAAKALAGAGARITLVDRRNHHLFQPLLYQVATATLSPAQIAAPIRRVLFRHPNVSVLLGEAGRVDVERRRVDLESGQLEYDYLVLAAGATHSYFGHDAWANDAPGLKSIEDALEIRRRFLLAFERAEREADPALRARELTFVVVGAGPTGVELAGAMAETARRSIPRDFRAIDTTSARIVLVEAMDHVLPGGFPPELSARAERDLRGLGVEVRLSCRVTDVTPRGVVLRAAGVEERIDAANMVWAAGVRASPLGATLGAELDASGRVRVLPDLSIPGHPEVFVIGDLAHVERSPGGGSVPGMAPGAIQMARHVAAIIRADLTGQSRRPAFRYRDKGLLATIGRNRAVAAIGSLKLTGLAAWLLWAVVHITYLIGFRAKLLVMLEWAWAYVVYERGARLITGERAPDAEP